MSIDIFESLSSDRSSFGARTGSVAAISASTSAVSVKKVTSDNSVLTSSVTMSTTLGSTMHSFVVAALRQCVSDGPERL